MTTEQQRLFVALRAVSIKELRIPFNGGNDEGGEEEHGIEVVFEDGLTQSDWRRGTWVQELRDAYEVAGGDGDELLTQLCKPIYDRYTSFNNEPIVDGTLIWYASSLTADIDATESFTESRSVEETVVC